MERFLESVADSISQLVLFSVDDTQCDIEGSTIIEGTRIVESSANGMNALGMFKIKNEKIQKIIETISINFNL